MPDQQPAIPHGEPAVEDAPAQGVAVEAQPTSAYEPYEEGEQDEWLEDPGSELPPRPRRRLLSPIPLALTGVLLIACGFIGGVLIEKGETSSSSSTGGAAGLASRFAALRGGAAGTSSTATRSGTAAASFGGAGGAGSTGFTRPTAGTVAYLDGSTLYVTNSEGNTVKVTTSAATSVTKTVKSSVDGIHPGETVTITGATGSGGAVSAESISVGSSGGGLAALFGGSSARGKGAAGTTSSSSEPSLFGG
jgi:hypothetical protein